jgi:aminopeptidase-like protein
MKKSNQILICEIDRCLKDLFPITRSITGPGNRKTLKILQDIAPLQIKEYSSGTKVYDWTIPDEWYIKDAWIKNSKGKKLIDFNQCNIHLVGYSQPIHKKIMFEELKEHLHIHLELENAIPYRTSYYKRDWGFCATHAQYKMLTAEKDPLEVYVDSEFNPMGSLTIGELLIQGESNQEVLISTYICHPSLANDNLSGTVMTAFLARELLKQPKPKLSYRIIWVPETIGAIAYCAMNEEAMKNINTGLVVTTVGGPGKFGYKQSYDKNHNINSTIEKIFNKEGVDFVNYPFDVHGSDERQYSSQGFRINIASITKDKYYEYPYYHTSLDNLDFVKSKYIFQSLHVYLEVLKSLDHEFNTPVDFKEGCQLTSLVYKNNYPNCEVMLSKHDLYPKVGGGQVPKDGDKSELDVILWLLFWCDGKNTTRDISEKINVDLGKLETVAQKLLNKGILSFV